jgi:hypothetical protein
MESFTMSAIEVIEQLKSLSNPERLAVIEAATRLVREDLGNPTEIAWEERNRRMRVAALSVKDLYELGGEFVYVD